MKGALIFLPRLLYGGAICAGYRSRRRQGTVGDYKRRRGRCGRGTTRVMAHDAIVIRPEVYYFNPG